MRFAVGFFGDIGDPWRHADRMHSTACYADGGFIFSGAGWRACAWNICACTRVRDAAASG